MSGKILYFIVEINFVNIFNFNEHVHTNHDLLLNYPMYDPN